MPTTDQSRSHYDLDRAMPKSQLLINTMRKYGIDATAVHTAAWTRRELLDVVLELTRRQAKPRQGRERTTRKLPTTGDPARAAAEDARWSVDDARAAYTEYSHGLRTPKVMEGRRVHQRRVRAAKAEVSMERARKRLAAQFEQEAAS